MFEGMLAKLATSVFSWLAIAGVIGALGLTVYIYSLKLDKAHLENIQLQKDLSEVVSANQSNQETIRHLQRETELANQVTQKEIAKAEQRAQTLAILKRKLKDAEGSKELMGTLFDDLADGLRNVGPTPGSN